MFLWLFFFIEDMMNLSPGIHNMLNERVVELLKYKEILTVPDLLRTDSNKLKQFLNFELADLCTLKSDLWRLIGIVPVNGLQQYENLKEQSTYIPTGIKNLDELLGGGLVRGNLIDICGFSSCGKTQLYTTIAVNWSIDHDYETFVVDTKGDFSGERIKGILSSRTDFQMDKLKHVMCNIKVEKCNSPFKLIELIRNLIEQMHFYPNLKLLVIDSLPALWFLFHGNKRSLGQCQLAILGDLLRKLAVEHGIIVITINISTRAVVTNGTNVSFLCADDDQSNCQSNDLERSETDLMNRTTPLAIDARTVPALGKHWKSICAMRLQIERNDPSNSNATSMSNTPNERTIRILKSIQHQTGIHCMVHLTDAGIT
ncbi:DNA repair protein RAD51 homolog 4 [Contarinia nasturtii]|uniref:DNA repair protein RAD51 homolog 4 n=1 Tax=Contarinia nasturtii TaxID=265458 RepID=UPI0012D376E3|nr:DNA repair protein RAD51 homolog 4 [Contarinia nasturtii]